MTDASRAVFLSYASQDAEAAQRICEGLRAAGIEVWFDQSELRGGDAWDLKIRQQIRDCALFVPIISVNTASRLEGYFRLEWKLAVDRSHLMAAEKPFLLPVDPSAKAFYTYRGFSYYGLQDLDSARSSCENERDYAGNQWCLAVTYDKLGRHADAEAEISKLKASFGDVMAYQYATFYAQRGDSPKALEWLETALRLRDAGLESLKTDSLMDPIRQEPRFQAVMRELKFPL